MVLDELRQKISSDDTILSVGSKSGYMFIGTRQDYDREIDAISAEVRTVFKDKLEAIEASIQSLRIAIAAGRARKDTMSPDMMRKRLAELEKKQQMFIEAIATFKPLRERKVIDLYPRINPDDGLCVIVEGKEVGEAWCKEEYDKAQKHKRGYGR